MIISTICQVSAEESKYDGTYDIYVEGYDWGGVQLMK